jgi:hypothetical protein
MLSKMIGVEGLNVFCREGGTSGRYFQIDYAPTL